jgi:hypothetical protein
MTMKNKLSGRPPINPDDVKSGVIELRIHKDLNSELAKLARLEGVSQSALLNRLVIESVNAHRGRIVLDKIGRHTAHKIRVA